MADCGNDDSDSNDLGEPPCPRLRLAAFHMAHDHIRHRCLDCWGRGRRRRRARTFRPHPRYQSLHVELVGKIARDGGVAFPAPEQLHPCSPKSGEFVVLAVAFLGAGSGGTNTSRLCHLNLGRISFPKFHNSFRLAGASFPSYLGTNFIVGDGFLSQQALTAALSATTQLKSLFISPDSKTYPEQRSANPPPLANLLVLRALIGFRFVGSGEYLEQLIFRIYAPLLEGLSVSWSQSDLDVLQLSQFISRTETADAVAPSHIHRSL